jgi:hypothetical protein
MPSLSVSETLLLIGIREKDFSAPWTNEAFREVTGWKWDSFLPARDDLDSTSALRREYERMRDFEATWKNVPNGKPMSHEKITSLMGKIR